MHNEEVHEKAMLGFWIYLMTDLIMFGALFAVYMVLKGGTFGGPSAHDIANLPQAFAETLVLLVSSFTAGLANLSAIKDNLKMTVFWYLVTAVLGLTFLVVELTEFHNLIAEGHTWRASAFLSSFFTLVGAHGLHIASGLLWMAIMLFIILSRGLTSQVKSQLTRLSLFWHFLDVVWIFIFTIVYLMA